MQIDFSTSLDSAQFLLGQVYDTSISQIDSYTAKTVINFGQPVSINTDGTVSALTDKTKYFGIAIRANYQVAGGVLNTNPGIPAVTVTSNLIDQYPVGSQVSVMRMGRVVIRVNTATSVLVGTTAWYKVDGTIISADTDPLAAAGVVIGQCLTTPVAATSATVGGLVAIQMNNVLINKLI